MVSTQFTNALKGKTLMVFQIVDFIEDGVIWFADKRGIRIGNYDVYADIKDGDGVEARFCLNEDDRETDDTTRIKVDKVVFNGGKFIIKGEVAPCE